MSRVSSASEGEATATQRKPNTVKQSSEPAINGSNRVFGLGGVSDNHGYNYRALSRSPSPYRRKRTRSPSPYRRNRDVDRSPSPYRRNRADHSHAGNDAQSHHKRKASPPRGNRPDKRPYTDQNEYSGHRHHRSGADGRRGGAPPAGFVKGRGELVDRSHAKPISYAEVENPNPVPDFRGGLGLDHARKEPGRSDSQHATGGQAHPQEHRSSHRGLQSPKQQTRMSQDVDMKITDDVEFVVAPVEEKAPTQELREEKRRRWATIRAAAEQHKPKEDLLHQAILTNASEATTPNIASPCPYADSPRSPFAPSRNGDLDSVPASPDVMMIGKKEGFGEGNSPAADGVSAADYDPLQDMLDDHERLAKKAKNSEVPSDAYHETDPKVPSTVPAEKSVLVKKKKEFDMFGSDDEDEDTEEEDRGTVLDEKLLDNWDDPDGYYKLISNELVNGGRYKLIKHLGRGVYANVAQAEEVDADGCEQSTKLVAVKMIRRNPLMRKASYKEMDFVRKANEADPQDKRHIVRLLGSFDHKGHLCIIFEHMSKSLRDLLKEETNGHGLTLPVVRIYAKQMFVGLQHLQNCQIIHLDLKPDNILVSADKKLVKLADFGTAVDKRDIIDRHEYLVSRFYRAPEIILGMNMGYPVDVWAIGCTVYELWSGKILFPGRSNNQMIKAFMDCLGWPSEKLLRKGLANNILKNFELGPPLKFISREIDQHNKLSIRTIEQRKKINRDMKTRVHEAARNITTGCPTVGELNELTDFISATLHMNAEKRITPQRALAHKFLASKTVVPKAARSAVVKPPMVKRSTATIRR